MGQRHDEDERNREPVSPNGGASETEGDVWPDCGMRGKRGSERERKKESENERPGPSKNAGGAA